MIITIMDLNLKEDICLLENQPPSDMIKSDFSSEIDSAASPKHQNHTSNDIICRDQLLEDALLTSDSDNCGICGQEMVMPRILHCLHIFCETCLENLLTDDADSDADSSSTVITCPNCNFNTKVSAKKIAALPLDVTKANISDVSNSSNLTCTSCTAKEVAKSSCNTCHNLLCGNCDTAHHYMRCFESHKVVSLEDLKKDGIKITIHKPLECELHQGENILYNCLQCNAVICSQCIKGDHKDHPYESVIDSEAHVRENIESLLTNSKNKIEILTKYSNNINNNMEDLAHQRTAAKDLINETYQSYKVILEKCKNESLDELNKLYHARELKIMKEFDEVGKAIGNLEDACKYSNRLLETGTALEMLYLRNVVVSRLLTLNINLPKTDNGFNIEFKTDSDNFEKTMRKHFGHFVTETDAHFSPSLNTKISNIPSVEMNGILSNKAPSLTNGCQLLQTPSSIQPTLDVATASNLQGFSSMAEFNIAQLATLAETTSSANTSPTSQFTLADLLTNDTAYKNLASLAKLGLNNTNDNTPTIVANGGDMLVRSTSSASINLTNNLMNGFGAVSTSTSPLLTTSEDILQADAPLPPTLIPSPSNNSVSNRTNKVSPMQIRCKFGQLGPSKGQFNSPHGFCLGLEEDIIVADTNNHRIQVFDKTGSFKIQFGIPGKEEGQLWYPRKVAVMRNTGKYVVCDRGNERSRMQIFTKNGHFIRKIAIRYIDIVAGLAVTAIGEIVAVDSVSPTVFIIHENGELLRWFDCSDYMREPSDIAIHGKEYYVCDFKGHNVVVFNDEGHFLRRIGCETLTNFPNGIDISDAGDILIGDSHGNRFHVAVFARDGSLISEFECPYVKVSRCCGLKITSEGYVVTLAKNNHHVLVLNTLYIL